MPSLNDYSPSNPPSPGQLAVERAKLALENGLSRSKDDGWIGKAAPYLQDERRCIADTDYLLLEDRYPDIYWAQDFALNHGLGESTTTAKSEIEARILAQDDLDLVAKRFRTKRPVIDAYTALFFDVLDDIENDGYIMHSVIGPAIHQGYQAQEYDLVWKFFGYTFGPEMLTFIIRHAYHPSRPQSMAEIRATVTDMSRDSLKRQAMLAVETVRINNFNAVEIIAILLKMIEVERIGGGTGGAGSESMKENVQAMMGSLRAAFRIGRDKRPNDPYGAARFDQSPIELRHHEMIQVATGQRLANEEEMAAISYPPSPHQRAQLEAPNAG